MREGYKIGNFTFNSEEEYKSAVNELKVIQGLKQKYDIDNPDVAKYLLSKVTKGSIKLETKIGNAFETYLHNVINKKKSEFPMENLKYIKVEQKRRSIYSKGYICFIVILFIVVVIGWYLILRNAR